MLPPEVVSCIKGPLPDPKTSRLAFDHLGIVEEAVEDLPEQDDGHEDEVDAAEDEDVGAEAVGQLLPLGNPLEVLPQVPLVEGRPGRFEEDKLYIEL